MSPLNYLSTFKAKFLGMSSFMNVELYHWYISFKIFNKTVYNEINRRNTSVKKEFFWMSSYTYYMSQKFIMKNFLFYCLCLRDILSDVKSNIMKQFTSYIGMWDFSFLKKEKTINWVKTFLGGLKEIFLILTSRVWNRFEKMHLTSKMFPHNCKSFTGRFKVIEKQK